jgi:AcrR family transcriptional regulator
MQLRVLEATIDCLYEVGYARTTTIEVAARAGVSRGAQLHHFPTKERLVTMAVRHLLYKRLEEFRKAFLALPPDADKTSAVIDLIWGATSSRAFYAWLELVVAARTDAALRKTVLEIQQQYWDEVQTTFREFFVPFPEHARRFEVAPDFAFATMYGLALDKIVWAEQDPRLERVLTALKALSHWSVQAHDRSQNGGDPSPAR